MKNYFSTFIIFSLIFSFTSTFLTLSIVLEQNEFEVSDIDYKTESLTKKIQEIVRDDSKNKLTDSSEISKPISSGTSFDTAITILPGTTINGTFSQSGTFDYYRYYSKLPYQMVSITLEGEVGTDFDIILYDQFKVFITSSTGSGSDKILQISDSEISEVRFIGWYYIQIAAPISTGSYNLSIDFLNRPGSSIWDAEEISSGTPAWSGIFTELENSGYRNSRFFKFFVSSNNPLIDFELSGSSEIYWWLYDPDMNLVYDNNGQWLANREGYYYLEVATLSSSLTINLILSEATFALGDTIDQPLEISRDSIFSDIIPANGDRYLQLYLMHGENVTIEIADAAQTLNFNALVYDPTWFWFRANSTSIPEIITFKNIPITGYYIFHIYYAFVDPNPKDYQVEIIFNSNAPLGKSWQSAELLSADPSVEITNSIGENDEYYYQSSLEKGDNLNITLDGPNGADYDIELLGPHRNLLVRSKGSTADEQLAINNLTQTGTYYFRIYSHSGSGQYTFNLTKSNIRIINILDLQGRLIYRDNSNKDLPLPIISILLYDADTGDDDLLVNTTTDSNGYFQITYLDNSDPDEGGSAELYFNVKFEGQAAQVRSCSNYDLEDVCINSNLYGFTYDLSADVPSDGEYNLGEITTPTSYNKAANIYYVTTHSWLWIENRTATNHGPPQVKLFHSLGSLGTYYLGASDMINLLGSSSDDDAWDDAVIRHEYGHFIQFIYDISNNPGGSHSYSSTISPGFAHGEGWPTFFSSMISLDKIYKDTYGTTGSSYFGNNLETGDYITSSSTGPLHDLYGEWGESSVMNLYWDLFDNENDDINDDGIGDSINIDEDTLWAAFTTYRTVSGHGVTTVGEFFLALQSVTSLDDEVLDMVARVYYDHGAASITDPILDSKSDYIGFENDLSANITWIPYDNNPASYVVYLDEIPILQGSWNVTEEPITVFLNDYELIVGVKYNFTILLLDDLGNERVQSVWGRILPEGSQLGENFLTALDLTLGNNSDTITNQSRYFVYRSTAFTAINFSLHGPITANFDLYLYNVNEDIIDSTSTSDSNDFIYWGFNEDATWYIEVKWIFGEGNYTLVVNEGSLGSSLSKPINLSSPNGTFSLPGSSPDGASYYQLFLLSGAYSVTYDLNGINTIEYVLYFSNTTEFTRGSLTDSSTSFNVQLSSDSILILQIRATSGIGSITFVWKSKSSPSMVYTDFYSYKEGTIGNNLTWNIQDDNPLMYEIYRNETLLVSETISSETEIDFNIDGLSAGTYLYTLTLIDGDGLEVNGTITVIVSPNISETSSTTEETSTKVSTTTNDISGFETFSLFITLFSIILIIKLRIRKEIKPER
ncbi:MAG: pre-peptidase C-terminal domain-containing protein [Candidatus Hodarchaeales archaeon]|jgi:hypothetical protein